MSGPKVVRIVTREELQALGREDLARFDAAVAALVRTGKQYGQDLTATIADSVQRREELVNLYSNDQWAMLNEQARSQTTYLRHEQERTVRQVIEAAQTIAARRRNIVDAARSVEQVLRSSNLSIPKELANISTVAKSADLEKLSRLQTIIDQSMLTVVDRDKTVADSHMDLAMRLGEGQQSLSFESWLATQPISENTKRLDRLIGEIETIAEPSTAQRFTDRMAEIMSEKTKHVRSMLTDALVIEVAEEVTKLRHISNARNSAEECIAILRNHKGVAAADMLDRLEKNCAHAFLDMSALVAEAQALIEMERMHLAAAWRRKAVLEGLAQLGYKLREGMATTLANNGSLVLRKSEVSEYGVEVGSTPLGERLQIQVVGANVPSRSRIRDIDAEADWCSEFTGLQKHLVSIGAQVTLERAIGIGKEPVKTTRFIENELDRDEGPNFRHT